MGCDKNQKYLLFGKISPIGSKKGQKTRPDSRRTFDLEICLSYLGRKTALRKTYLKKELEKSGFQVELNPKPNPLPDAG